MKYRKMSVFIIISLFLLLFTPNVLAASTVVSKTFNTYEYYQGGNGEVDVWITNNGENYFLVEKIQLSFDYGESGYKIDKTDTPIRINVGEKVYIGKISFNIESSISIGHLSYKWLIIGKENKKNIWGSYYLSSFENGWFGSNQIYIETPLKSSAEEVQSNTLNNIKTAQYQNFESVDAKSKISQAEIDYNSCINAINGRDFTTAINYANSAKKLISESYYIEQTYQTNKANALSAKNEAKNSISNVQNLQSVDAKNKINEANSHFSTGETHFYSQNFNLAISEYNSAKSLAEHASNLEVQYQVELKIKQEDEAVISVEITMTEPITESITEPKTGTPYEEEINNITFNWVKKVNLNIIIAVILLLLIFGIITIKKSNKQISKTIPKLHVKKCPNCNRDVNINEKFCLECGTKIE